MKNKMEEEYVKELDIPFTVIGEVGKVVSAKDTKRISSDMVKKMGLNCSSSWVEMEPREMYTMRLIPEHLLSECLLESRSLVRCLR